MAPTKTINIAPRDKLFEPGYRYRMPMIVSQVEGRGNGVKTRIKNMVDIAKALHRSPAYTTKFFGTELGAQTKFDAKTNVSLVNGAHQTANLQAAFQKFVELFVLCPKCKLADTTLYLDGKKGHEQVGISCTACGENSPVEQQHKLCTFIAKHPPEVSNKGVKQAHAKAESSRAGTDDLAAEADRAAAKVKKAAGGDDDDFEWSVDTSKEATEKRLLAAIAGDGVTDEAEQRKMLKRRHAEEKAAELSDFLHDKARSLADKVSYVRALQRREKFGNEQRALILCDALLGTATQLQTELAAALPVLVPFTRHPRSQMCVLGAVADLVDRDPTNTFKFVPGVLKALYDAEVVDEEVFLQWADGPSTKYFTRDGQQKCIDAGNVFIEWLRSADEESSEEDSDDESEEDSE